VPIWLRLAKADCSVVDASSKDIATAAVAETGAKMLRLHPGTMARARILLPDHLLRYIYAFFFVEERVF
jgi:hypothetical protein